MRRAAIGVVALALLAGCGTERETRADPTPSLTPASRAEGFMRPPALRGEPCGLEASKDDLWILTCSGTLLKLPKNGRDAQVRRLNGEVLALDGLEPGPGGRLWALVSTADDGARAGMLVEIDPAFGAPGQALDLGASVPMSAASAGDTGWVAMLDGRLLRVGDGSVSEADRGPPLIGAVAGPSELWTIAESGDATLRDATSGEGRSTLSGVAPETIASASAFGALWAATSSKLVRIAATGDGANVVDVDGTVNAIEPCGDELWVSQADFGVRSLSADGSVASMVDLDVAPRYLACDGATLWVLSEDGLLGSIAVG